MSFRVYLFLSTSFILCCFQLKSQENSLPGEYIVHLKYGTKFESFQRELYSLNLGINITEQKLLAPDFYYYWIKADLGTHSQNILLREAYRLKTVEVIQNNHTLVLRETIPNDISFVQQYALRNTGQNNGTSGADIKATQAWDITTGGLTSTGDTIVVAVIDGGCQISHPDLSANIFINRHEIPGNDIDDDENGYIDDVNGWNPIADNGTINNNSHGTHVSGIISAVGNNNIGVAGVNWAAKILPIQGSTSNESVVVAAYLYATNMRKLYNQSDGEKGAFIVATNSSFGVNYGNPDDFPIWCAMYDTLGKYGILSAGATINSNVDVDVQNDIPTTCPGEFIISVTNTNNRDLKHGPAGYGVKNIDIAAPGTAVLSTVNNGNYSNLTGTSMSTPHVAGVIALMYAVACPKMIHDYKNNPTAMALLMKKYLYDGADIIASLDNLVAKSRRLNAFGALEQVLNFPCEINSPPLSNFSVLNQSGCPGTVVNFNNLSVGNPTSFHWYFQGGTPAESIDLNPTVQYFEFGNFDVMLISENEFGKDTLALTDFVSINNLNLVSIYEEDFEDGSLASKGWEVLNPDNQNTWELATVLGTAPGNNAASLNIFFNQDKAGQRDGLISPIFDFSENTNHRLTFTHAHRRRVTSQRDSLIILVSTDNGLTYTHRIFARAENGEGTFATGGLINSNFIPQNASDWCLSGTVGTSCFSIDLSQFDGQSQVKLMFEAYNDAGNNIYLDNINIEASCKAPDFNPPLSFFTFSDNIICEDQSIQFFNQSVNMPTSWEWFFEGGTPNSSLLQNPIVTFYESGTYGVRLIVNNPSGTDTLVINAAITVIEKPETPLITIQDNLQLSTDAIGTFQWFLNGVAIDGATNQHWTALQNGQYTVSVTDNNLCSSFSESVFVNSVNIYEAFIHQIKVYPKPAKDFIYVDFSAIKSMANLNGTILLIDLSGKKIYQQRLSGAEYTRVPVNEIASGIYILKLECINFTANFKVIVSK